MTLVVYSTPLVWTMFCLYVCLSAGCLFQTKIQIHKIWTVFLHTFNFVEMHTILCCLWRKIGQNTEYLVLLYIWKYFWLNALPVFPKSIGLKNNTTLDAKVRLGFKKEVWKTEKTCLALPLSKILQFIMLKRRKYSFFP